MADGDEKIDHNERVLVLNRVTDAPTEVMFDGKVLVWAPSQVRSCQKYEAKHFVEKSLVVKDPTYVNPPVYKLVVVDEQQQPIDPVDSATPLTLAQCKELAKFGSLDTSNLAPEREVGGHILMDTDGNTPQRRELRGAPKDDRTAPPAQHV